ncbi:response regulator transcription factor [Clostridium beijerinckii]|uniref:Stage 0 sporulation protein A homolog n=1 Tax=Clostridium beijerinckii TaxID=1520 RepID=A0A9Q5CSX1_CLOBE|nr:response regulator transcription factor [Clostridium beijerinckii]AQS06443.1 sensory transduction protein regX3 [Clostridium beijerinckii]MBA2885820.1 DNA-binding response OmpR family regulator [Clostridium beijerinckii]MBA2900479.1 DNA-binding response OmpR family regulator [Clostridium beijerinckii]MBA2910379.1 DNA-binding response OmpR family regulator [Clostridium beijerinckii]MBA9013937.1 DNA-binding response OmpR family regulator [Clostridium beijerinckii]
MQQRISIIEDDLEICNLLKEFLKESGYEIKIFNTGIDGMRELRTLTYDLVILDLMLPYKSGDEILRELRSFSNIPVIVLSAKDMVHTKVELLRLGADDYVTKPFDLNEILARVESNLRRCSSDLNIKKSILTYKDITLYEEEKKVIVNGNTLVLTSKEYGILFLLLSHPQKVFSKANLFESIWNEEYFSEDNTLNVHISNIRNKLKSSNPNEEYIETIWGMGYKLK